MNNSRYYVEIDNNHVRCGADGVIYNDKYLIKEGDRVLGSFGDKDFAQDVVETMNESVC